MALYSCSPLSLSARKGGANGNKFKLNCYIYTRVINNWNRGGAAASGCALRETENARAESTAGVWESSQFAFSIGWLDLTILPPANEHYVYIIRLNDFRVSWRKYWHCPIWFRPAQQFNDIRVYARKTEKFVTLRSGSAPFSAASIYNYER